MKTPLDHPPSAVRSGLNITESGDLPNTTNRFRRTKRLTQKDNLREGQWSRENVTPCYKISSAVHYTTDQASRPLSPTFPQTFPKRGEFVRLSPNFDRPEPARKGDYLVVNVSL